MAEMEAEMENAEENEHIFIVVDFCTDLRNDSHSVGMVLIRVSEESTELGQWQVPTNDVK